MSITHAEMVRKLVKPGVEICEFMSPWQAHMIHMAMGIAGEAGEIIDAVKKNVIYGKILDEKNILEELGDIMFYIQGICQEMDITLEEVLEANIKKLGIRYTDHKYSDLSAIERADKE